MPRVIVTTDISPIPSTEHVLLDEEVQSVHLSTGQAASQLVQRIAWAVGDAEARAGSGPGQPLADLQPALA
jgi:hypothetical protein